MNGVVLALLSTLAAVGGISFGTQFAERTKVQATGPESRTAHQEESKPRFAAPDIFVYPMHDRNTLGGYVVFRFAMVLSKPAEEAPVLPDQVLLADAFLASMFKGRATADAPDELPDVNDIATIFLSEANRSAGVTRFETALLQQFDVFQPETVRRKNVQDRNVLENEIAEKPVSSH